MTAFVDRLRHDENGFSLTELLTAMLIGSIVLWALMTLMTTGLTKSLEVSDRAEAAQSGRVAMDRMVTLVDSTICLDPINAVAAIPPLIGQSSSPAVTGSDGNYMAFYADLDGVSDQPDKYTLRYDATAKTITEQRYDSTGALPNITISTTPSQTRVLATDVVPARTSANSPIPIFQYFKYQSDSTIDLGSPLATPIPQTSANDVIRVLMTFTVISRRTKVEDGRATKIEAQSAVGTPDSSVPNAGACP